MSHKIVFTLAEIRKHSPCKDGWVKLNKNLGSDYGDDTPITIEQIINSNGLDDAIWCLRATPRDVHYLWGHFTIDCVESIKRLMGDDRSLNALKVARLHAQGEASDYDLENATLDAWAAADAAWAAADAAWAAAWAAAGDVAGDVADAAWAAADAARADVADAAWAAADAARADAARAAARDNQKKLLIEYCRTGERVMNAQEFMEGLRDDM